MNLLSNKQRYDNFLNPYSPDSKQIFFYKANYKTYKTNNQIHEFITKQIKIQPITKPHNPINHILDDQTQVDLKPIIQPEQASLNQCQLIAANRPILDALRIPSWWWR